MAKVLVYSSDTCPYCVAAKDFLKEKNVDFIERNVSTDHTAKKELIDMKQMEVPPRWRWAGRTPAWPPTPRRRRPRKIHPRKRPPGDRETGPRSAPVRQ